MNGHGGEVVTPLFPIAPKRLGPHLSKVDASITNKVRESAFVYKEEYHEIVFYHKEKQILKRMQYFLNCKYGNCYKF